MNDTTRDELRKQVGGELVIAYTIGSDRKETDFTDTADRIIALVTEARDAEIREALLSDGALDVATSEAASRFPEHYRNSTIPMMEIHVRAVIAAALDHIGLHGDGLIRCTNCNREGTAKAHVGIQGHKMPDGWEQREIIDPIAGTELVRKWEATLCPDCAKKETDNDHE